MLKAKKGFTIIELLVAMAIIAILFVTTISKVNVVAQKSRVASVETDFKSFYTATEYSVARMVLASDENFADTVATKPTQSAADFNLILNANLDKGYKFTNGISDKWDAWGYPYRYVFYVDPDTNYFYIMFSSRAVSTIYQDYIASVGKIECLETPAESAQGNVFEPRMNLIMGYDNLGNSVEISEDIKTTLKGLIRKSR